MPHAVINRAYGVRRIALQVAENASPRAWPDRARAELLSSKIAEAEATMPMFTIVSYMPRPPPEWRKVNIFARMRPLPLPRRYLHWRDPVERLKTLRRRSHTLVDDNPASG
jgi:hypothetical protein